MRHPTAPVGWPQSQPQIPASRPHLQLLLRVLELGQHLLPCQLRQLRVGGGACLLKALRRRRHRALNGAAGCIPSIGEWAGAPTGCATKWGAAGREILCLPPKAMQRGDKRRTAAAAWLSRGLQARQRA